MGRELARIFVCEQTWAARPFHFIRHRRRNRKCILFYSAATAAFSIISCTSSYLLCQIAGWLNEPCFFALGRDESCLLLFCSHHPLSFLKNVTDSYHIDLTSNQPSLFPSAEYVDDIDNVPRNTSIIVARNPVAIKGRGNLAKYLNAAGPTVRGVKPGVAPAMQGGAMGGSSSTAPLLFSGHQAASGASASHSYVAPKPRQGDDDVLPGFEKQSDPQQSGGGGTTPSLMIEEEQQMPADGDTNKGDEEDDLNAFLEKEAQQWQKTSQDLQSWVYSIVLEAF